MNQRLLSTAAAFSLLVLFGAWAVPQPAPAGFQINSLPATINESGTWCVTGNLTAGPGETGIVVTVPNVIIDLGGYTLTGAGSSEAESGVQGFVSNIQVRNGTLANWGGNGILLGSRSRVQDAQIRDCGLVGIQVLNHATIENCILEGNLGGDVSTPGFAKLYNLHVTGNEDATSISTGTGGIIEDCFVEGAGIGIDAGLRSRVQGCTIESFKQTGMTTSADTSVIDCFVSTSATTAQCGIETDPGSRVEGCQVRGKAQVGILVAENSVVRNSLVDSIERVGILAKSGSRVLDCTVTRCNTSAAADGAGIEGHGDVSVRECMIRDNLSTGLRFVGEGGQAIGCSSIGNDGHGFDVKDEAVVLDCLAKDNSGIGIHVVGNRGRVQRNTIDENNQGLVVNGLLNLVSDNRSSQNSAEEYVLPWGNTYGKVDNSLGQISGSVPHANFASN